MSGNVKTPTYNYSTIHDKPSTAMVQEKTSAAGNRTSVNSPAVAAAAHHKPINTDQLEGWWCSCLDSRNLYGYDSALRVLPSSGNRVFRGGISEHVSSDDTWDVSELMEEMRDHDRHRDKVHSSMLHGVPMPTLPQYSSPRSWLSSDRANGFISVYNTAEGSSPMPALIPCKLSTTAHDICLYLRRAANLLYVVFGDLTSRCLGAKECPLIIQNDFLGTLGHSAIKDIQDEGINVDLQYLIKFYIGLSLFIRFFSFTLY